MLQRFAVTACLALGLGLFGLPLAWAHEDEDVYEAEWRGGHGPPDLGGLSAYGEWVWESKHGRVWRPHVEVDWRPYWRGHWAWHGAWVWVSSDPWGDGPFHYGDWVWSQRLGWVWIPGTVWAPARVTWIIAGPVVAWAPAGLHVTLTSDPRFLVYADSWAFHTHVARPHRRHPSHVTLRGGVITKELSYAGRREASFPRHEVRSPGYQKRTFVPQHELRRQMPQRPTSRLNAAPHDRPRSGGGSSVRGFEIRARP